MVSNASPGTAAPKMKKSFIHMAHVSSDRECAQDGYLKRLHPTIIDRDIRWDSGWFLGVWGWGTLDTQLARLKLGKQNTPQSWPPPSPYSRHGGLPLAPPHETNSQHAAQQVYVVKTRKYTCFYYLLAILRHDALSTHHACVCLLQMMETRAPNQLNQ